MDRPAFSQDPTRFERKAGRRMANAAAFHDIVERRVNAIWKDPK
jgi:hypothetical protein